MSIVSNTPSVTYRRSLNVTRKPRPISIAVTGVSVLDGEKLNKQQKPPLPKQNSNKKKSLNIMSRSMDMSNKLIDLKNSPRQSILDKTNEMVQSCFEETTSTDLLTVQQPLIDISIESPSVEQLNETEIKVETTTEIKQDIVVEDIAEPQVSNNISPIDAENNEMTGLFKFFFDFFIYQTFFFQLQQFLKIELQLKKKLKLL